MERIKICKESSIDNPIDFFNYYFLHNGYHNDQKRFFVGLEYLYDFIVEVNKEEEFILYVNNNDEGRGTDNPKKDSFSEQLKYRLLAQVEISKDCIDKRINNLNQSNSNLTDFLKLLIGKLEALSRKIKENTELRKYKYPLESIYKLGFHIFQTYHPFLIEVKSNFISDAINFHEEMKNQESRNEGQNQKSNLRHQVKKTKLTTFKWLSGKEIEISHLYFLLTNSEIISRDVPLVVFTSIFQEKEISKPLKIKWMLKTHGSNTKPSLIRFFRLLMVDLKLIDYKGKTDFSNTLKSIFIDSNGKDLGKIAVNLSQIIKREALSKEKIKLDLLENNLFEQTRTLFSTKTT